MVSERWVNAHLSGLEILFKGWRRILRKRAVRVA
jgi:hypothetical protein